MELCLSFILIENLWRYLTCLVCGSQGETLMCTTCYKRAKDRLQEYIRRKQTEDESSRSNAVTTVGSMETASQDSFDRIVNQVSMRSVQRISREGRALVAEVSDDFSP